MLGWVRTARSMVATEWVASTSDKSPSRKFAELHHTRCEIESYANACYRSSSAITSSLAGVIGSDNRHYQPTRVVWKTVSLRLTRGMVQN